ncbi:MAG: CRISPR-associated RAMP protein Csx10 [Ktedonobacteraceae bacterium]|nr:CRISPR-associated RAMP protein Csx10 [Ktedonobacteraceae bacterium]
MKHFAFVLIADSPLAIRSDHAQEGAETARYIPGITLAGSLAAVHRQFYPDRTDEFKSLFLSGQVQYPDLYPASFKNEDMQNADYLPVYPLPATAQTCKRFQGFRHIFQDEDDEEGSRHGVRDSLLDWTVFRLLEKASVTDPAVLLDGFRKQKQCSFPGCEYALDRYAGYYRRDEQDGQMMYATVATRLQTHTGINRGTGTVQEGILYNRRVFEEDSRFWGAVKVADEVGPVFNRFIKDVGQSGLVRIGTGRTRGMGKVRIDSEEMKDEQRRFDDFEKRLAAFHQLLCDTAAKTPASAVVRPDQLFYFTLTLHSPVILRDALLRYRCVIDERVLANRLALPADHFTLIHSVASSRRIMGWNDLWGTPKVHEVAIETGSVFLFAASLPQQELAQALFRLEEEGIGERRSEGFGRVCISDPFHREVKLR